MEHIEYNLLNGSEIQNNFIEQYIEINLSENPKFTREIRFETFKNLLHRDNSIKIILATSGEKLLGWLMISFAENRGLYHFNMLVHREFQRAGIGKQMLTKAKENYDELYGVVVPVNRYKRRDGTQYKTPIDFYKKNGFSLTGKKFVEYRDVQLVEIKWSTK